MLFTPDGPARGLGGGKVTYAGVEQLGEVVEVVFDKGRTAKFVAAMAGLDLLKETS